MRRLHDIAVDRQLVRSSVQALVALASRQPDNALWEQALELIDQDFFPYLATELLVKLAPTLPRPVLPRAFRSARRRPDRYQQALAVAALTARLHGRSHKELFNQLLRDLSGGVIVAGWAVKPFLRCLNIHERRVLARHIHYRQLFLEQYSIELLVTLART